MVGWLKEVRVAIRGLRRIGLGTALLIQLGGAIIVAIVISLSSSSPSEEVAAAEMPWEQKIGPATPSVEEWVSGQLYRVNVMPGSDVSPINELRFRIWELSQKYDILGIEVVSETVTNTVSRGGGSSTGWGTVPREKYALVTVRPKATKPK